MIVTGIGMGIVVLVEMTMKIGIETVEEGEEETETEEGDMKWALEGEEEEIEISDLGIGTFRRNGKCARENGRGIWRGKGKGIGGLEGTGIVCGMIGARRSGSGGEVEVGVGVRGGGKATGRRRNVGGWIDFVSPGARERCCEAR